MTSPDELPGEGWVSREVRAMMSAWNRGDDATARDAIDRHPDLDLESAIRLIYEETCLRREAGLEVRTTEVVGHYPRWAGELRALFECDRLIRAPGGITNFPGVGERLGPFELLAELGRGASGRTYLATDPALADRPVVVKVIPDDQDEHLALARLRHTHIVPLFSEHTFPAQGLRGLCMPFLGGASLAQILDDLADVPFERRTGKRLVKVIDHKTRPTPATPQADGPFRRNLEQASFVQAMVWITACLADALHYAHARGLVHMDIKPSNVLITMDGQPMLLDFHLARGPMLAGEWVVDRIGGTPGWMSPEQEAAVTAVSEGRPLPDAVDGRADLFSLGLLLSQALGLSGSSSIAGEQRSANVSLGLRDLLRKCLAPDPRDRYNDAARMADDLRRELSDLPLRGVRNRSPRERWQKWRRRHPGALAWCAVGLIALTSIGVACVASVSSYRQTIGQLYDLLEDGRRNREGNRHAEAIRILERGIETARGFPTPAGLNSALRRELRLAERGRLARDLHSLADRIRFRYGIELPSHAEGGPLLYLCRGIWNRRDQLLGDQGPFLDSDDERTIRTDLLELAVIQADLRGHLAPPETRAEARADALRLLQDAESTCGSSFAIETRREQLGASTGPHGPGANGRAPKTEWEHYERGRFELRGGRFEPALRHFGRTLESKPQDFWPNFYHGLCGFRLGRFADAVADFQACIVIAPDASIGHYNRALAYDALGRSEEASRGYSKAIELEPALAPARLNRGIIAYKAGRYADAIADFDRGLEARPDREMCGRLYFNLALARLARHDRVSARSDAEKAESFGCRDAEALHDALR